MSKIMANETYKVGDLVQLKSSGPAMTVYEVSRSGLHVKCQWFDGAKLEEGDFAMISLQLAEPEKTASKTSTS